MSNDEGGLLFLKLLTRRLWWQYCILGPLFRSLPEHWLAIVLENLIILDFARWLTFPWLEFLMHAMRNLFWSTTLIGGAILWLLPWRCLTESKAWIKGVSKLSFWTVLAAGKEQHWKSTVLIEKYVVRNEKLGLATQCCAKTDSNGLETHESKHLDMPLYSTAGQWMHEITKNNALILSKHSLCKGGR